MPDDGPLSPLSGLSMRMPPSNVQAEQALLGAILANNKAFERARFLKPEHFADPINGRVFDHLGRLIDGGRVADAVTLKTHLEHLGVLEEVGGTSYITSLLAAMVGIINAGDYAKVVRDTWVRREIISVGEDLVNAAFAIGIDVDPTSLVHAGIDRLDRSIIRQAGRASSVSLDDAIDAAVRAHDEAAKRGGPVGISTGFDVLDKRLGGLEPGLVYVIAGRPGSGKAQPLGAKILKADGTWTTMGDIRLGDALASIDGQQSRVLAIHDRGIRRVYQVSFSDGRSTECCADHLWRVMYRDWAAPRVISTATLARMLTRKRYKKRLSIEVASGHFGGDNALLLDPYVLGVLLGDGSLVGLTPRLTSADAEIVDRVQSRLGDTVAVRRVVGSYAYSLSSRGLPTRLTEDGRPQRRRSHSGLPDVGPRKFWPKTVYPVQRAIVALGLDGKRSDQKFIPDAYFAASRDDRLELLRGLLDTDGYVGVAGGVSFTSSSRQLANGVQRLVRSLGGLCSISFKQPTLKVDGKFRDCLPAYVCNIRHPSGESLFALTRKSIRAKRVRNNVTLTVRDVVQTHAEPVRCITVTHPSSLYVTDDYILTHNSALGHTIAVNAARMGVGVLEISLEMSATQLGRRALATAAKVPLMVLKNGWANGGQAAEIVKAQKELRGLPITIDDGGGKTAAQIVGRIKQQRRKGNLGLVLIDHLNLMRADETAARNGGTWATEQASGAILSIAKDAEVPVLLLAQLNRDVEKREDHRPQLSDLRQAGAIEQDAYAVSFVYRPEYYLQHEPEQKEGENDEKFGQRKTAWEQRKAAVAGLAEIITAKVRDGEPGTDRLRFDGPTTSFSNWDGTTL